MLSETTSLFETVESVYCNDITSSKRVADANLPENANKSRNLNITPGKAYYLILNVIFFMIEI